MAFLSRVFKNLQWYGMTVRRKRKTLAANFFYCFEQQKDAAEAASFCL